MKENDFDLYLKKVDETDRFTNSEITPILLGLFGEVGSIMATSKKYHREKTAYFGYKQAVIEEFGDALWYLCALSRRINIDPKKAFAALYKEGQIDENSKADLNQTLLKLGLDASTLLSIETITEETSQKLYTFISSYISALYASRITLSDVITFNTSKICGRFIMPDFVELPDFDNAFPLEEQIPRKFEIKITQRKSGRSYLQYNGVFIGDPLTDNIRDKDGYRFHDVLHLSHAAILHWSPTFRALIKHKRKSKPDVDEAQDSGRAIVVEEGLSTWIFSRAKELDFFEGQTSVSFDLLKTIQQFVSGYEVEACPLKLWEHTILEGYKVFRQVYANNGGIIIGDREARTIQYKAIEDIKNDA